MTPLDSTAAKDGSPAGGDLRHAVEDFFGADYRTPVAAPYQPAATPLDRAKQVLRHLYYYGTLPYRAVRNAREAAAGRAPVIVLFYHRVADDRANPWTMSNAMFARHVRWLQTRFDLVSLTEAQQRIRSRANHRPTVSITFDDGYADNCDTALPLLVRERIPFTYFVSSKFVLDGLPFPHDVALGRPLRPNTIEQLKSLAAAGVEIGAHTRTHCDLAQIEDLGQLYEEIVGAREELQEAIDCRIRYFAFPFGRHVNLTAGGFQIAREAGYAGVCSAYGGYNFPGDDSFHLQRIHGDDDMGQLKNWTTLDPRKLRGTTRFEYDLGGTGVSPVQHWQDASATPTRE